MIKSIRRHALTRLLVGAGSVTTVVLVVGAGHKF